MTSLNDLRAQIEAIKICLRNSEGKEKMELAQAGAELVAMYLKSCGWIVLPWIVPVEYNKPTDPEIKYKPVDEIITIKKFKVSVDKDCGNCGHRMKTRKYMTKRYGMVTAYICNRCKNQRHKRKYKIFVE